MRRTAIPNLYCAAVAVFALMMVARDAAAQQTTTDAGGGAILTEVVVTAQKREQRLQDVPVAIDALDAKMLERQNIKTEQNLQFAVPSLVISSLAGFAQTYLRGIGTEIISPNADAGVATYVDGIYSPNLVGVLSNMLGIERVEVLYGPQGTLYGRNAVGGAVSITTLSPTQELKGSASLGFGNYNEKELQGFISGGVTDRLAVGIYAAATERSTYLTLDPRLDGDPGHEQSWGVRVKAVYDPIDELKITTSFEHQFSLGVEANAFRQAQPNATGFAVGAPVVNQPYVISADYPSLNHFNQNKWDLKGEYDLNWSRLVSLTDFQTALNETYDDIDATAAPLVNSGSFMPSNHSFSQELQLLSPANSKVTWIAGLYEYRDHGGFDPTTTGLEIDASNPPVTISQHSLVDTVSLAAFGQLTYPLTDALRLTLGARYTHDKKTFTAWQDTLIVPNGSFTPGAGTPIPGSFVQYPESDRAWSKFTPKVSLDYRLGDTLLYATFSEGYKSGTYNISDPSNPGPVNPETLKAYEVGSKSDLLGGRARFNASVYYYDYKDLQVTAYSIAAGTGIAGSFLQNAATAKIYGLDLSAAYLLTDELTLNVVGGYLHAHFDSFPGFAGYLPAPVGNTAATIDASGNTIQRSPKYTSAVNLDYNHTFVQTGSFDANLSWSYDSGYYFDASDLYKQGAFQILNSTVSYTTPPGKLTFSLWGTNLTNAYYRNAELVYGFGTIVQDAPPRMFGGRVQYKFGK